MRIFVYEWCVALGLGQDKSDPAHSLYREGKAMRDALAEDFRAVPGITVLTCDGVTPSEEERRFRELAQLADFTVAIAPEFDGILATRVSWVPAGRWLGSSLDAIRLTSDKLELAQAWQTENVPTPWTTPVADWPSDRVPVVMKPRDGAGSTATYLCRTPKEFTDTLILARREWPGELIAQDYVTGHAVSLSFLVGPSVITDDSQTLLSRPNPRFQALPLVPTFQRLSADGRFRYQGGEYPLPADLARRAEHLGRQALTVIDGLQGYIGIDLILGKNHDGSEDCVIEVNPRLTTSYLGLRQLTPVNLAGLMLQAALGQSFPTIVWSQEPIRFFCDGRGIRQFHE
jgi:predicted ATP-grasp superfamily ATP-dependent carboligase